MLECNCNRHQASSLKNVHGVLFSFECTVAVTVSVIDVSRYFSLSGHACSSVLKMASVFATVGLPDANNFCFVSWLQNSDWETTNSTASIK
jgi:hypothetical protein